MAADLTPNDAGQNNGSSPQSETAQALNILAIDIGGTGLKASVIDHTGAMIADKVRVATPHPCPPGVLVEAIANLVKPLPHFDRIAIGFPGAVRANVILTAPHLGEDVWHGVNLAALVSHRFEGIPTKIVNDAEMQGLAVIKGEGLEVILTLGTGCGTGIFYNGELAPHLELSTHPIHKKYTYDLYVGNAAFEKIGKKRWNKRVERVIATIRALTHFDRLYIGGGNSKHVTLSLPTSVRLVSNEAGIDGGARLWSETKGRHPEYDIQA